MVKVLVGGSLSNDVGAWEVLVNRVKALQASQHGPFDVLLVSGPLFASEDQYRGALESSAQLCVPTYIAFAPPYVGSTLPGNVFRIGRGDGGVGMETISRLTVAYVNTCSERSGDSSEFDSLKAMTSAAAYRGCDVLLSDDWPKDMHHFIEESEYQELQTAIGPGFLGLGSPLVSNVAVLVRPRYHFSVGRGAFFQRSPYRNVTDPPNVSPVTRFIGLAPVSGSKDKNKKWLHALSLDPIVYLDNKDLADESIGTTDSPYVSIGPKPLVRPQQLTLEERVTSQNAAKRIKTGGRGTGSGALFFGNMGMPRPDSSFGALPMSGGGPPSVNLVPPSPSAVTLFIGNVPRSIGVAQELQAALPGCVSVRVPEGKSFAFAEFRSHEAALNMVNTSSRPGEAVVLMGRQLSIGWASSGGNSSSGIGTTSGARATISQIPTIAAPARHASTGAGVAGTAALSGPPSADVRCLFLGGMPTAALAAGGATEGPGDTAHPPVETESVASGADADPSLGSTAGSAAVLAELSPLLPGLISVRLVPGKTFVFAEFDSHDSAAAAVATHGIDAASGSIARPLVISGGSMAADGSPALHQITVSWARSNTNSSGVAKPLRDRSYAPQSAVDLTPPSDTACCLFVGGVPHTADDNALLSVFQVYLGGDDGLGLPTIRRPPGKTFAFLEFASHAEAMHAMQGVAPAPCITGRPVTIGWAKGRPMERQQSHQTTQKSDHDESCWFCLASPQLKAHLVLSVGKHSYLALPRGGMHHLHCLIVPIECVPNRIHSSPQALCEIALYETAVERLHRKHNHATLVFERCIRTQGKDHSQTQLVPIPADRVPGALGVFLQVVGQRGLKFREIEDSRGVDEVVVSMEGGPYQEYFYIAVPVSMNQPARRFVFVLEEEPLPASVINSGDGSCHQIRFPMMFGNEVAAQVLGQPERARWKNYLLAQDEEEKLAEGFRKAFQEFEVLVSGEGEDGER